MKKRKLIADLHAAIPEPVGFIRWRDNTEHDVRNPVDCAWPDHLKLLKVEEALEAAIDNAPKSESEFVQLGNELNATVEGLRALLKPLVPTVTDDQWASASAFDVFLLARSIRAALIEASGKNELDPTLTRQTTKAATSTAT